MLEKIEIRDIDSKKSFDILKNKHYWFGNIAKDSDIEDAIKKYQRNFGWVPDYVYRDVDKKLLMFPVKESGNKK